MSVHNVCLIIAEIYIPPTKQTYTHITHIADHEGRANGGQTGAWQQPVFKSV